MWPFIICNVHLIVFHTTGAYLTPYIPPQQGHKVKVINSAQNKQTKKRKKSKPEWQISARLAQCLTLHTVKWEVSRVRKCIRTDLGCEGNWWPHFSVCASVSISVWEQNGWTGTQIWNLISGYNDAACVCVCVLFTVIALAPLSLQHLYRPHILLQLDL